MDRPTMEDSLHIQKFKQKLREKQTPKNPDPPEDPEGVQIDFEKYMKEGRKIGRE